MRKRITFTTALGAGLAASLGFASAPAQAYDGYLGEIIMVGNTFCPRNTAEANGQLLPISQFSALFSLLGTQYGGDGRTTFALPKMSGSDQNGRPIRYCMVIQGIYPSRS